MPCHLSPSCRHTTSASLSSHWSSHMEPHWPAWKTSTVPSDPDWPPTSRIGSVATGETHTSLNIHISLLIYLKNLFRLGHFIHFFHPSQICNSPLGGPTLLLGAGDSGSQRALSSIPSSLRTLEQVWLLSLAMDRPPMEFSSAWTKQGNCTCAAWDPRRRLEANKLLLLIWNTFLNLPTDIKEQTQSHLITDVNILYYCDLVLFLSSTVNPAGRLEHVILAMLAW